MARGPRPEKGGAEAIGDLLGRLLTRSSEGRAVAREELEARWEEVARARIGEHARGTLVRGLRDGVLTVEVDGSALLSELSTFHERELLAALRKTGAPFADVREIHFKLGA
jgi:predicted nucleic acid-binding Zn ribbon protein